MTFLTWISIVSEQILDYKKDLAAVYDNLLDLDLIEDHKLINLHTRLVECAHKVQYSNS